MRRSARRTASQSNALSDNPDVSNEQTATSARSVIAPGSRRAIQRYLDSPRVKRGLAGKHAELTTADSPALSAGLTPGAC